MNQLRLLSRLRSTPRWIALFSILLLAVRAESAHAQDTTMQALRQRGITVSAAEILQRLRESGLSREQVRQRLRQAGYDPNLADRYFDELAKPDSVVGGRRLPGLAEPLPRPGGNLLQALASIGLIPPGSQADSVLDRPIRRPVRDSLEKATPQVFGKELFAATTTEFQPIMIGPVDPGYRLGPDDEVRLIVTGDVETGYNLTVTREGYIVIPEVGRVDVGGKTLEEAKRLMNTRLARVYSGIQTGATSFDLSVGRLRRNLVTIIGDVDIPGTYPVSGGATVFNALYLAGGPSDHGSFRSIDVKRENRVIGQVDLYDYLLRGDKGGDIRLEQGDIIFVPVVLRRVTVTGKVLRPAIFELKPSETLSDVLMFAGGVGAEAALERIQIDRILPAGQRSPGMDRTFVDVPIESLRAGAPIPLHDGDHITVFAISGERRNRLTVSGDVQYPGVYEFRPGMTAQQLIQNAQGLLSTAYTPAAHIVRLNRADSTTSMVRISLSDANSPNHASRVQLLDLDELVIYSRPQLINPDSVQVFGLVKREGAYAFSDGLSVQDLVLQAGGFREGALTTQAEVARRRTNVTVRGDTLADVFRVPLGLAIGDSLGRSVQEFELEPGDQVFIRRLPGYLPLQTIEVLGEVVYPGSYTVEADDERISHLIRRAGGLSAQAYARGLQLIRNGKQVGVNLPAALERPGGPNDLIVRPGDRLTIPFYDPLVLVTGAVAFESLVRFEPGLGVEEYLRRAGGTLPEADRDRISVRAPNGELRTTRSMLSFTRYPRLNREV
ncbi:MAG: SLBB domain-containing protein [Gemmatimonadota bacterium]